MAEQTMSDRIEEVFALLAAPFEQGEVRQRSQGGRTLHYVTASTVANRLDDVLGPQNWEFELKPWGEDALFGTLSIKLPDGSVVRKMNVGGCADMSEGDNDAKSAASDCLKRCAAMLGVARYLYGCGVPRYVKGVLGIDITDHMPKDNGGGYQRSNGGGSGSYQSPRQQADRDRQQGRDQVNQQFSRPNGNGNGGGRQAGFPDVGDPGRMPTSGGGLFAWSRKKEDEGYQGTLRAVSDLGKKFGFPDRMKDWNPQDIEQVWGVITGGGAPARQAEPAAQTIGRDYVPGDADEDEAPF